MPEKTGHPREPRVGFCNTTIDGADADCFICGDGVVQPGEECDDRNTNPFDGCDQCILVNI